MNSSAARGHGDPATTRTMKTDKAVRLREHEEGFPLCCLTISSSAASVASPLQRVVRPECPSPTQALRVNVSDER